MPARLMRPLAATAVLAVTTTLGALALTHWNHGRPGPTRATQSGVRLAESESPALARRPGTPRPVTAPYGTHPRTDAVRAAGDPVFGQPTIVGVQGYGFEEDLRLDPTNANRMYTSSPDSLSSDTAWIWRSDDAGKTFKWVPAATEKEGKPTAVGGPCHGGGDTELGVDGAGHLYLNDLTLANFSVYRSDDQGGTFTCSNTGVPDTIVDRQWYAPVGDPTMNDGTAVDNNTLYLTADVSIILADCPGNTGNEVVVWRSPPPTPAAGVTPNPLAGITFGPHKKVSCDEGIMGNDEVSPIATTTNDGGGAPLAAPVRHVYVVHDSANLDSVSMGRCTPVPFATDPSGLQCTDHLISSFPGSRTGGSFATMAIDKAGNLYAVWEQATVTGGIANDDVLKYSYSTDEGNTWAAPVTIVGPSTGLNNEAFAWIAAGDAGRVDVGFIGTPGHAHDPAAGCNGAGQGGTDSVNGIWSLYMVQSLNANTPGAAFTAPILAGEHYIHKGSVQTLIGNQCGDRTLGDFFQTRIGPQGEANMSFADSNNPDEGFLPHAMYVRQVGGNSLDANVGTVNLPGNAIQVNSTSDVSGDGTYSTSGVTSPNDTAVDITQSAFSVPSAASCHPSGTACYRITMTVNSLSAMPSAPTGDTDAFLQWMTQWLIPADPGCVSGDVACTSGGENFMVYAQYSAGTGWQCWDGQNAAIVIGGGVSFTYPGVHQITTAGACTQTAGTPGTITIDVPVADVTLTGGVAPLSASRLYSVTAATTSSNVAPDSVPPVSGILNGPIGGVLFNLLDQAPAYDAALSPTAVALSSFSARRASGGVQVRWRTASETEIVGFDLFRSGADGRLQKLNRTVIRARHAGTSRGGSYRFLDRTARAGTYRLRVVDFAGRRRWAQERATVR
jgi:hypothetical protein